MAEREYRRLTPARSRSRFAVALTSKSSLWLGKDHLLQVDTNGYTETYKRFHFRDIQAFIVCKTRVWLQQAAVLGAITGLLALIALLGSGAVVAWIFGSLAGLFGLALLLGVLAGPTSKCYVRTAVQTEHLVSLSRLRRAEKVLAKLRPLITRMQGELTRAPEAAGGEAPAVAPTAANPQPSTIQAGPEGPNPPSASPA